MAKRGMKVVRKGSLTENWWLTRQCGWTKQKAKAARFSSSSSAVSFANRCGKTGYGVFPASYRGPRCNQYWCPMEDPQGPDRPISRAAQRWAEKWDLPQD